LERRIEATLRNSIPGRELNRRFYRQAVAPILLSRFPGLRYSAALLGSGSDVLGYDTEQSMDHDWGLRAQLFLAPRDSAKMRGRVVHALGESLPQTFEGLSTRFTKPDSGDVRPRMIEEGELGTPKVWVGTIHDYFQTYLHVDPFRRLGDLDWLLLPSQKLL
jgi:hypothetical protein